MKKIIITILIIFAFLPILTYAENLNFERSNNISVEILSQKELSNEDNNNTPKAKNYINLIKIILFIIFIAGIIMTIIGIIKMKK